MDFIFNSTADVAVMLTLLALSMFGQGISAAIAFIGQMKQPEWYKKALKHVRGLAPLWVFFLLTFIVYVMVVAAFYIVYRQVAITGLFGEAIDVITLFLIFNTFLGLVWIATFFGFHRPGWAMAEIIFFWITAIILEYFLWVNNYQTSFGLFFPALVWFIYPFYVNATVLWHMRRYCDDKKRDRTDKSDTSTV
jgi:tryptophan-rich sensory protein